jgi:hypothetical protein
MKGHQVPHDVKARSCQCMGHGFPRHHQMAFGHLPLVQSLDLRTEAESTLGRLHRGPFEIGVAIFGVTLTFTLAVAQFRTPDTTAV